MAKYKVILDGDPGHDDAIAWMVAGACEDIDILAVTTVAGNKDIDNVTNNALNVCSLFKINAPIAKGVQGPLVVPGITAGDFHGATGLDGADLPERNTELSPLSAVELMVKALEESNEPIIIIATGAQTNVATLLLYRPDLKSKIKEIRFMGGGIYTGNWIPSAEFNILVDPEAVDIVLNSGIPVVMNGLDVTEKSLVYPNDVDSIRNIGTPIADIVGKWLDFFGETHAAMGYKGWPLRDPNAVLSMINPDIYTIKDAYLTVDTKGLYTRGATIADFDNATKFNAKVVLDVDREKFVEEIIKYTERYK